MTTDLLTVEHLRKSFPARRNALGRVTAWEHAVHEVNLRIGEGETLALVGESGAGKSTVGRLVLRMTEADGGAIRFQGQDIRSLGRRQLRRWRRHAQLIFQDPFSSLDPRMTVGVSVAEPLKVLEGLDSEQCDQRVLDLFRRVGLAEHHVDGFPYEFSGGQLQRLAVARAIATEPSLIVCDEPVAALDVSIRAQIINLLADLQRERGVSYLFISHDLGLVRAIAHRTAVMYQGRIVEEGSTRSLFRSPRHPYTKALLEAMPLPDPRRRHLRGHTSGRQAAAPGSPGTNHEGSLVAADPSRRKGL